MARSAVDSRSASTSRARWSVPSQGVDDFLVVEHSRKEVIGADAAVASHLCSLDGMGESFACALRESFKHRLSLSFSRVPCELTGVRLLGRLRFVPMTSPKHGRFQRVWLQPVPRDGAVRRPPEGQWRDPYFVSCRIVLRQACCQFGPTMNGGASLESVPWRSVRNGNLLRESG